MLPDSYTPNNYEFVVLYVSLLFYTAPGHRKCDNSKLSRGQIRNDMN